MFHKKIFTFHLNPARFVYDNPESGRTSAIESQEALTQKYLDPKTGAKERSKLYDRADETIAKARPATETNILLKDKVDKLQARLNAIRELEKKNDVFAHEAITIHRFVESINKIMDPKQVEVAKGTPVITTRAETKTAVAEATKPQQKTPDTSKAEVHKTAEIAKSSDQGKTKAKTREEQKTAPVLPKPTPSPKAKAEAPAATPKNPPSAPAPKAQPAESGPKYNVQNQADRYRLYSDSKKLVTEVTSALPSAEVTRYANILLRQIERNEAQEKTTEPVGIMTSSILIKNAGKALVALNKGTATPKDLETLKALEAAEKAPAAKASAEKAAAERKSAGEKAEFERKAAAEKVASQRKAAAEKVEAEKKAAAEKAEAAKRTLTDKKTPVKPKETAPSTLLTLGTVGGTEGPRPTVPTGTSAAKPKEAMKEQMPDEVMQFFNSKIRPMVSKAAKTENPQPFSAKYQMGDKKTTYYFDITFTQTKDGNAGSVKIRKEVT